MGELRQQIIGKTYNSIYSIHPCVTKIFHDIWKVFWLNGMRMGITDFVVKCPNCQEVMVEHQ